MSHPKMKQVGVVLGMFLLVLGGILLYTNQENDPSLDLNNELSEVFSDDDKGQSTESPYAVRRFTPIQNAKNIANKALSFIGLSDENVENSIISKGTFPAVVEKEADKAAHEQAIFAIVFPQQVLASFDRNQNKMILAGIISESSRNPLSNEDDAVRFIRDQFALYLTLKDVSLSDKQNAARALEQIPQVIANERLRAERILQGKSASQEPSRLLAFLSLSIPIAHATWYTDDPCYKDDAEDSGTIGTDLSATCCNCGFYYDGYDTVYYDDCLEDSTQCNIPLGCLNLYCEFYENAIWDSRTSICGCG